MAVKKTEQENIQENTTEQENITEQEKKDKSWIIKVANNPEYCGVGAGGIQFADGQAVIRSERMAKWFREHKGYTVIEQ